MTLRHLGALVGAFMIAGCGSQPVAPSSPLIVVSAAMPANPDFARATSAYSTVSSAQSAAASPAMMERSSIENEPALMPVDAPVYAEKQRDPYHLSDVAYD